MLYYAGTSRFGYVYVRIFIGSKNQQMGLLENHCICVFSRRFKVFDVFQYKHCSIQYISMLYTFLYRSVDLSLRAGIEKLIPISD